MHIIYGHCAVGGAERTTEKTRALQQAEITSACSVAVLNKAGVVCASMCVAAQKARAAQAAALFVRHAA